MQHQTTMPQLKTCIWSKSHRIRENDAASASENDSEGVCWMGSLRGLQRMTRSTLHCCSTLSFAESRSASIWTCFRFFCPPLQGLAPQHHTNRSTLWRYWKPAFMPNYWQSVLPYTERSVQRNLWLGEIFNNYNERGWMFTQGGFSLKFVVPGKW